MIEASSITRKDKHEFVDFGCLELRRIDFLLKIKFPQEPQFRRRFVLSCQRRAVCLGATLAHSHVLARCFASCMFHRQGVFHCCQYMSAYYLAYRRQVFK
jgi:hypothetical protein